MLPCKSKYLCKYMISTETLNIYYMDGSRHLFIILNQRKLTYANSLGFFLRKCYSAICISLLSFLKKNHKKLSIPSQMVFILPLK